METRRPGAFDDVRMRGFHARTPLSEVQAWIDAREIGSSEERVPLDKACGRVLSAPLIAGAALPPFARAMMDGWAVQSEATFGATQELPITFSCAGEARPGAPSDARVTERACVRVMTGARLPQGADAVVPAEYGRDGDEVAVWTQVPLGKHVAQPGEDAEVGATLVPATRPLRPQDLGMASALGYAQLVMRRLPLVRVLITGDELQPAGVTRSDDTLYDADGPMLRALLARDVGVDVEPALLGDDEAALREALAAPADVLLVTGGTSVGAYDYAPSLVAAQGELVAHGIALRPAAPAGVGALGATTVFLLPGNPVACLAAYDLLAGRLLRRWSGRAADVPYARFTGQLTHKVASVLGRVDYVRVALSGDEVTPIASRGASRLSTTTCSDGYLLVPHASEGYPIGATVSGWLYDY